MTTFLDEYTNEDYLAELLQSQVASGFLQNDFSSGSSYYSRSRTTSDNLLPSSSNVTDFGLTVGKKAGDTNGRIQISEDGGTTYRNKYLNGVYEIGSYDLNGTNQYLYHADDDALSFRDGSSDLPFSFIFRVNFDSFSVSQVLAGKRKISDNSNIEYLFYVGTDGKLRLNLYDGGTSNFIYSRSIEILKTGKNYTLGCSYDGSESQTGLRLYINGYEVSYETRGQSGTYTGMPNGTGEFCIGYTNASYLNGKVSLSAGYSHELTEDEMLSAHRNFIYPTADRVFFYRFNGDATDDSSNGFDLTLVNAPTNSTDWDDIPPLGSLIDTITETQGASFNGTSSKIEVADSDDFSFTDGAGNDQAFSVSIFVRMKDATAFRAMLKGDNTTTSNWEWAVGTETSDKLQMVLYGSGATSGIFATGTTALTSLQRQTIHIGFTYDGSESSSGIKLYLNGVAETVTPSSFGSYTGMSNLAGALTMGVLNNQFAKGDIIEGAIWNGVRTAGELLAESNAGVIDTGDADLIEHWALNGNSNGTNGNNGTDTDIEYSTFASGSDHFTGEIDGTNDYFKVPSVSNTDWTTNFTLNLWITPLDTSEQGKYLKVNQVFDPSSNGTIYLRSSGTTLQIFSRTTGGNPFFNFTNLITNLQNSRKYMVTITWDTDDRMRVYVDTVLRATSAVKSGATFNNISVIYLGRNVNDYSPMEIRYSGFTIDTSHAWSQSEIDDTFDNGYPSSTILSGADHHFPMKGNGTDTINGVTMTANNGAFWIGDDDRPIYEVPSEISLGNYVSSPLSDFRYRTFFDTDYSDRSFGLESLYLDYDGVSLSRRVIIFNNH